MTVLLLRQGQYAAKERPGRALVKLSPKASAASMRGQRKLQLLSATRAGSANFNFLLLLDFVVLLTVVQVQHIYTDTLNLRVFESGIAS